MLDLRRAIKASLMLGGPGLALPISVLAHRVKLDNTVSIGALVSHLAVNKVIQ